MTSRASTLGAPWCILELPHPYPLLEYLFPLPGDRAARPCAGGAEP